MAALGGLLLEPELIGQHYEDLNPGYFYEPRTQKIALAMLELFSQGQAVDIVTVKNHLAKVGDLGEKDDPKRPSMVYLSNLQEYVATTAHTGHYLKIIKEKARLREIYQYLEESRKKLREGNFENSEKVIDDLQSGILELTSAQIEEITLPMVLDRVVADLDECKVGGYTGYPWPLPALTQTTGGIIPGKIYALGGSKGTGKTKFLLHALIGLALNKIPSLFFSQEMTEDDIAQWIISWECEIDTRKFGTPFLGREDIEKIKARLEWIKEAIGRWIFIDSRSAVSVSQVIAKTKHMMQRHRIKVMAIDYLQRMQIYVPKNEHRGAMVNEVVIKLANFSKDSGLATILLSQLGTKADHKIPTIRDLKESGGIGEGSTGVLLIDNHDLRKRRPPQNHTGRIDIIVAKSKNTPTGATIKTIGKLAWSKFVLLDDKYEPQSNEREPGEDDDIPFSVEKLDE